MKFSYLLKIGALQTYWIFWNCFSVIRVGADIVEGYAIHPDKPWCLPFAVGEVELVEKVTYISFHKEKSEIN